MSLRAWCLALQTLTLVSNEPSEHVDPHVVQPLDSLLGGMASCVVKDRNTGPMLLRLLSGNGLNFEPRDKQYTLVSCFSQIRSINELKNYANNCNFYV